MRDMCRPGTLSMVWKGHCWRKRSTWTSWRCVGDPSRSLRASGWLREALARLSSVCRAMGHWSMCPAAAVLQEVSWASCGWIARGNRRPSTSPQRHM